MLPVLILPRGLSWNFLAWVLDWNSTRYPSIIVPQSYESIFKLLMQNRRICQNLTVAFRNPFSSPIMRCPREFVSCTITQYPWQTGGSSNNPSYHFYAFGQFQSVFILLISTDVKVAGRFEVTKSFQNKAIFDITPVPQLKQRNRPRDHLDNSSELAIIKQHVFLCTPNRAKYAMQLRFVSNTVRYKLGRANFGRSHDLSDAFRSASQQLLVRSPRRYAQTKHEMNAQAQSCDRGNMSVFGFLTEFSWQLLYTQLHQTIVLLQFARFILIQGLRGLFSPEERPLLRKKIQNIQGLLTIKKSRMLVGAMPRESNYLSSQGTYVFGLVDSHT